MKRSSEHLEDPALASSSHIHHRHPNKQLKLLDESLVTHHPFGGRLPATDSKTRGRIGGEEASRQQESAGISRGRVEGALDEGSGSGIHSVIHPGSSAGGDLLSRGGRNDERPETSKGRENGSEDGIARAESILLFRQQIAQLQNHDSRFRLRALACLQSHLDLLNDPEEQDYLLQALLGHLQREDDPDVAQHVVRVLSALAILCCKSEPDSQLRSDREARKEDAISSMEINCQFCCQSARGTTTGRDTSTPRAMEAARSSAQTLLAYLVAEDLPMRCRQSVTLKLQILRSLRHIGEQTRAIQLDALNSRFTQLLAHCNPAIRAHVLLLLAIVTVTEVGAKMTSKFSGKELSHERVRIFQEYTQDSDAVVRKAALESLITIGRKGFPLGESCYVAATVLLEDSHDVLRSLALQVIGLYVEEEPEEGTGSNRSNDAFIQVCRMMLDMNLSVRIEAGKALAKIRNVREDLLLQALSKKPLGLGVKEKELSVSSVITIPESDVDVSKFEQGLGILDKLNMGAFVHGIEDEFLEVRASTVQALGSLCDCSLPVRESILELLVDMLNDESKQVRSNTLLALYHISHRWGLVIKDNHLHMLYATLEDTDADIRGLARILLAKIRLPSVDSFKSTIQFLMNNLQNCPKEDGVYYTLYMLGKGHSKYVQFLVEELVKEMKIHMSGDGGLDTPCCQCILTLFLAAATSDANLVSLVPSQLLSLAGLFRHKLPPTFPSLEVETINPQAKIFRWLGETTNQILGTNETVQKDIEALETSVLEAESALGKERDLKRSMQIASSGISSHQEKMVQDFLANQIRTACNVKSMLDGGMCNLASQVLSGCRRDLKSLLGKFDGQTSQITFALHYIECLILLARGWIHFQQKRIQTVARVLDVCDLCSRLEFVIKCMRHAFVGHSLQEKIRLLEMSMIPAIWRVACIAGTSLESEYRELVSAMALIEMTMEDNFSCTPFIQGIRENLLPHIAASNVVDSFKIARQLASSYWPKSMPISDRLAELKAELSVPGNDFEHPLSFVPGVPLGITISVFLNQSAYHKRIWVCMQMGSLFTEYVFLDKEEREKIQPIVTMLQINSLPSVSKCTLNTILMLECPVEAGKTFGRGPRGFLLPLSPQKEIHLVSTVESLAKKSHVI